ncbi:DUF4386 domain-containing protein [Jiulongibacter sediminis]|jgi:hypothetical protein|uniref:DUF4386 domain-containing protein n=1 Tax=Jiulongibacter sediminis TaxID=1605367 RepID=UPI0026F2C782|nr:DUF4386 domain-containing protein [Jiulongibacter sediminis]
MTLKQAKISSKSAGLLYLIIALVGGLSIGYMPTEIVVDGDASMTFQNLINNQSLFKWGIAGDIAVLIMETLLTVILYQLFKAENEMGMTIATFSRMAMAIIMGVNLVIYMVPAILLQKPDFMSSFSQPEIESLTLLSFKLHNYGILAWQIFFAIHLFTLGFVIRNSGNVPKYLGLTMLIGGIGYGGDSIIQLLFLDAEWLSITFSSLLVLAVAAEFWFAFWLLIKGYRRSEING